MFLPKIRYCRYCKKPLKLLKSIAAGAGAKCCKKYNIDTNVTLGQLETQLKLFQNENI